MDMSILVSQDFISCARLPHTHHLLILLRISFVVYVLLFRAHGNSHSSPHLYIVHSIRCTRHH